MLILVFGFYLEFFGCLKISYFKSNVLLNYNVYTLIWGQKLLIVSIIFLSILQRSQGLTRGHPFRVGWGRSLGPARLVDQNQPVLIPAFTLSLWGHHFKKGSFTNCSKRCFLVCISFAETAMEMYSRFA